MIVKVFGKKQFLDYKIIAVFIAFLIGLYGIGRFGFWRDESFTAVLVQSDFLEVLKISSQDTFPPLHNLLLHFIGSIFGYSEVVLRSVSLLFGLTAVWFTCKIGEVIFDSKLYRWLVAGFAVFNPLILYYSIEARSYSMLMAVVAILTYLTLYINKQKDIHWKWWLLWGITAVVGLYTHSLFVIILAVFSLYQLVFLLTKTKDKKFWKDKNIQKLLLTGVGIVLLYLPWLPTMFSQSGDVNDSFWLVFNPYKAFSENVIKLFIGVGSLMDDHNLSYLIRFVLSATGVPLLVFGIAAMFKSGKNQLASLFLFLFTIFFAVSFVTPVFYIRYIAFLIPLVVVLTVYGLKVMDKYFGQKAVVFFGIFLIFFSGVWYLGNIMQNPNLKPDYTNLISDIDSFDDCQFDIILPNASAYSGMRYYYNEQVFVFDPERDMPTFEGKAIVREMDYYDTNVEKDCVLSPYIWSDSDFENWMNKQGFAKESEDYGAGLKMDRWRR